MREYVDQLTRQDRVVVVAPHRARPTPPPHRKRGAGLGALALVALLCLPLLGSATLLSVRAPDVEWRETPRPEAVPCAQLEPGEQDRPAAPTLWTEPTPRTLRVIPGLDEATSG